MAGMTPVVGENKELSVLAGSAEEARLAFACRFPDGVGGSRLFFVPLGGVVDIVNEFRALRCVFRIRKVVVNGQGALWGWQG